MDAAVLLKFFLAFVFVIGMMLLLQFFVRRLGLATTVSPLGAKRRLKIIEHLPLDHRRKLMLVRCDDREHLLVLGPGGETVVSKDILVPVDKVVALETGKEKQHA